MKRSIFDTYSYFVSKLYDQNYQYFYLVPDIKQTRAAIDWCVNLLTRGISVDENYIFDYCAYQFDWILKKSPRYTEVRVPFHQVFGKTSIERWLNVSAGYQYYISIDLHERGIKREHVVKAYPHMRSPVQVIDVEENEKKRFLNTPRGFSHCLLFTTLYNKASIQCIMCNYKSECKEFLKKRAPGIHYDREKYVEN